MFNERCHTPIIGDAYYYKSHTSKSKVLKPERKACLVFTSIYCVPDIVKNKCVKYALKPKHGIKLAVLVKKHGKSGKKKK